MPVDPSTLALRVYPDPVLRRRAAPIVYTPEVRAVALRMLELMRQHEGIGLAAPQVGLSWRLFVTFVPEADTRSASASPPDAQSAPGVYINPLLAEPSHDLPGAEEGCLSLPDIRGVVHRPATITIRALDLEGQPFERRATGLLARCWQHEMDHLDGVLILDKMTHIYKIKNRGRVRDLEQDWDDLRRAGG